jgi:hypothetical protein
VSIQPLQEKEMIGMFVCNINTITLALIADEMKNLFGFFMFF